MSRDDWPSEDTPIPAVLLRPEGGGQVPSARARNTNWKGVVGILIAVVAAPNLLVAASALPEGPYFAVALGVVLALPLLAVLAGVLIARDIRAGASSSRGLAVASIVVGLGMTLLMITSLLALWAFSE